MLFIGGFETAEHSFVNKLIGASQKKCAIKNTLRKNMPRYDKRVGGIHTFNTQSLTKPLNISMPPFSIQEKT